MQYKGKPIRGTVEAVHGEDKQGGKRKWVVRFKDKFVKRYLRKQLEEVLVVEETEKAGKRLDYILVSARHISCVR